MEFLTTEEVSILFNQTSRNIRLLVSTGKLKPINPNGKSGYLFKKPYIIKQLEKRERRLKNA